MARHPSQIDVNAPIRWVTREEYDTYFKLLSPDDRWSHPQHSNVRMIWHWDERRWWAMEQET
jgi:hypothetical protein